MTKRTGLGLPTLREETYLGYISQLNGLGDMDRVRHFLQERFDTIRGIDPLYAKFITDTSAMYSYDDKDVAWAEFIAGREMLSREGELPLLDERKFKERWDATMKRAVAILNVGVNMDLISVDNPIYWHFIMNSTGYFPQGQRVNVMSDLSSGYMFLADNTKRS